MLRDLTAEYERQHELEAYAKRTTEAREEERGRIARQLHDGPVQSLVLLWRQLDALPPLDDPEREGELRAAQRTVRDTADELRRVSRDLRPPILDDLGLPPALRAEVNLFSQRTGIPARLVCVGVERRLGPERELALLRIAQEALRNVSQHARAHRAAVRLQFDANRVRLSISDDGQGVDERRTAELAANGKLGMIGMREQARLIGAAITVSNGRRGGTVVGVSVEC
jgi:signal transduction histidine kinase